MKPIHIPWWDASSQDEPLRPAVLRAWAALLERGMLAAGEETTAFEDDFRRHVGAEHAVACSDGTTTLVLALRAMDIGPGDEVMTAPTSFFATAEAIALVGARPIFADVDEATGNLDPAACEAAVTARTRAIIAVHLGGRVAPMAELAELAGRRGLRLLEDAAQAHDACYRGRRAGALADAGSFSFYPTKNLGAYGQAGAVTTSDTALAGRMRALREHGQTAPNRHEYVGYNARCDGLQAAALRIKLAHLPRWTEQRIALATRYRELLAGLPIGLPPEAPRGEHVYHLFTVRTRDRELLASGLRARGVEARSHYPTPLHLQPAFRRLGYQPGAFPAAERYAAQQLSLPLYPGLPLAAQEEVASAVRAIIARS